VVDTRSAYKRAWDWTGEWFGSRGFYVVEFAGALVAGALVWLFTGDFVSGLTGLALGAVVAGPAAYLWRWLSIRVDDRLRSVADSVVDEGRTAPTPDESRREQIQERFDEYYYGQVAKLERQEELVRNVGTLREWREFSGLAWRTITGLDSFSPKVAEYVTLSLEEGEKQVDRTGGDTETMTRMAQEVLETMREARTLFIPN
jgi:hypothetical protein